VEALPCNFAICGDKDAIGWPPAIAVCAATPSAIGSDVALDSGLLGSAAVGAAAIVDAAVVGSAMVGASVLGLVVVGAAVVGTPAVDTAVVGALVVGALGVLMVGVWREVFAPSFAPVLSAGTLTVAGAVEERDRIGGRVATEDCAASCSGRFKSTT